MSGDPLDGYDYEEKEEREDGEAFGSPCLILLVSQRKGDFCTVLTTTPWSQAKMASSYRRVTRSQRAVEYPATKIPRVTIEKACMNY